MSFLKLVIFLWKISTSPKSNFHSSPISEIHYWCSCKLYLYNINNHLVQSTTVRPKAFPIYCWSHEMFHGLLYWVFWSGNYVNYVLHLKKLKCPAKSIFYWRQKCWSKPLLSWINVSKNVLMELTPESSQTLSLLFSFHNWQWKWWQLQETWQPRWGEWKQLENKRPYSGRGIQMSGSMQRGSKPEKEQGKDYYSFWAFWDKNKRTFYLVLVL